MLTSREKPRGTRVVVVIDREKKDEGRKKVSAPIKKKAGRDGQTEEEVVLEMATSTIFITKIFFFLRENKL